MMMHILKSAMLIDVCNTWVDTINRIVIVNDVLTKKAKRILDLMAIDPTPMRIEILKAIMLKPDANFTMKEIVIRLQNKGKHASPSIIADTLLTFRMRGLLSIAEESTFDEKLKHKRGRPAIKLSLSKRFLKIYISNFIYGN